MNLTIEQMREIVEGAPSDATWVRLSIMGDRWLYGRGNAETSDLHLKLSALRQAIADHELTDHCTNIKNHVSPLTKVIEK